MKEETKFTLRIIAGGSSVALVGIASVVIVGQISQLEAFELLKTMLPTMRFFCSAVLTGTSTILALMITLVSLSRATATEMKDKHYRRIQRIAMLDAIAFAGAMMLLLFIMTPMEESQVLSIQWYRFVYYGSLSFAAIIGAIVVSVVMMLYSETKQVIRVIGFDEPSPLAKPDDGVEEDDGDDEDQEIIEEP